MPVVIVEERADTADAMRLIAELDAVLTPLYPSESRHGLSVEKLLRKGVYFFVARVDGQPAACGGVQFFGEDYAEVKRMYVRPQFRGQGLALLMLEQLETLCREHHQTVLRLETGIHQTDAIRLYERFGFRRIPPFGDYFDDPVSLCYEKRVELLI